MNKVPMTTIGAEWLRKEVEQLIHTARPKVIHAIAEARKHGDLKENAEYLAAKEEQSFIEGRIHAIEANLASAQVIDIQKILVRDKVIFASTVTFLNVDTEEELTYQIVGTDEADVKAHKISIDSPLARAAIGKSTGEIIEVRTPPRLV